MVTGLDIPIDFGLHEIKKEKEIPEPKSVKLGEKSRKLKRK